jgi:hypothetical protein
VKAPPAGDRQGRQNEEPDDTKARMGLARRRCDSGRNRFGLQLRLMNIFRSPTGPAVPSLDLDTCLSDIPQPMVHVFFKAPLQ